MLETPPAVREVQGAAVKEAKTVLSAFVQLALPPTFAFSALLALSLAVLCNVKLSVLLQKCPKGGRRRVLLNSLLLKTLGQPIEVTSAINLAQGARPRWKFVYQIYPPTIDTLATGMGQPASQSSGSETSFHKGSAKYKFVSCLADHHV